MATISELTAKIFITDIFTSLFPRLNTLNLTYLPAMVSAVPALFSWGKALSGTS